MNFTREPIVETVITPREGCKLIVRSSKSTTQEDYCVDAVEVVSFGHSFFFRSQERPKPFLVPVSDYEILESKETRMILKNASSDQSIKIGGGRDTPRPRENDDRDNTALTDSRPAPERQQQQQRRDGGKRRRRRGRDRGPDAPNDQPQQERAHDQQDEQREAHDQDQPRHEDQSHERQDHNQGHERQERRHDHQDRRNEHRERRPEHEPRNENGPTEEVKAPSFMSKLFPPPQTLIRDTISRYQTAEGEIKPPVDNKELPDDDEE